MILSSDKSILCYVFDQDGTLYPRASALYQHLRHATKQWLADSLVIHPSRIEAFYERLQTEYPNPIQAWRSLGLSVKDYHTAVFDSTEPSQYLGRDDRLVELLSVLTRNLFIVTLASPTYSIKLQHVLGISSIITGTYYASDNPSASKEHSYRTIAESLAVPYERICVVGDNAHIDLDPAKRLGCATVHISLQQEPSDHITIPTVLDLLQIIAGSAQRSLP